MQKWIPENLILRGQKVSLEPLSVNHIEALLDAASDGELWNLEFTVVPNAEGIHAYVNDAIENRRLGLQQPFVVRQLSHQDKIVGCTRYYDLQMEHRNLAIGYTWYARSMQRTAVNTEAKFLLLKYAFEQLNCLSVAFHTDNLNLVSQTAITRLGAQQEGVLRNNKVMPSGRVRDTWCYSIIDREWPAVKTRLADRMTMT